MEVVTTPHTMLAATQPDTFLKLCLLWTALHRTSVLPKVCKDVIPEDELEHFQSKTDISKLWVSLNNQNNANGSDDDNTFHSRRVPGISGSVERENHVNYHFRYTSRSLSVIGVLGGIVLILLLVALSTCIKNRRNLLMEPQNNNGPHESFARQILIDHIRHLSSSSTSRSGRGPRQDTPPSYDDVVKDAEDQPAEDEADEAQPPSYVEAVADDEAVSGDSNGSGGERHGSADHVVTIEITGSSTGLNNDNYSEEEEGDLEMGKMGEAAAYEAPRASNVQRERDL